MTFGWFEVDLSGGVEAGPRRRRSAAEHRRVVEETLASGALTVSPNPSDYLKKLRHRDASLADAFKGGQIVPPCACL